MDIRDRKAFGEPFAGLVGTEVNRGETAGSNFGLELSVKGIPTPEAALWRALDIAPVGPC